MDSIDLATFLRARLDEDEAAATAATPGPWTVGTHPNQGARDPRALGVLAVDAAAPVALALYWRHNSENARHIARHDPARVLAEVAAKRAIVDGCEQIAPTLMPMAASVLTQAVRVLAAVYSDHPDYREALGGIGGRSVSMYSAQDYEVAIGADRIRAHGLTPEAMADELGHWRPDNHVRTATPTEETNR